MMEWLKSFLSRFTPRPPVPPKPPAAAAPFSADDIVLRHNAVRAANRVYGTLVHDPELSAIADGRAAKAASLMLTRTHLHDGFVSYPGAHVSGENAEYGSMDAASVMKTWMNSSGHRENILDERYLKMGAGRRISESGVPYWYTCFAG